MVTIAGNPAEREQPPPGGGHRRVDRGGKPDSGRGRLRQAHRRVLRRGPARYDRARPRYPGELIDRVLGGLPGRCRPGRRVRDRHRRAPVPGRRLRGARGGAGARAWPRSPSERGLPVEVAKIEDWDPAGRTFDALIAAMTWHWVDPAGAPRKRPGPASRRTSGVVLERLPAASGPGHGVRRGLRRVLPDHPMYQHGLKSRPRRLRLLPHQDRRRAAGHRRVRGRGAVALRLAADVYPRSVGRPRADVRRTRATAAGHGGRVDGWIGAAVDKVGG